MNQIRYLLDENVNPRLRRGLLQRSPGITVWQVGDPGAPELGTLDPDILAWCESNGFTLVTNNRASMPVHLHEHVMAERSVPGIFLMSSQLSMGDTIEELVLIWEFSEPGDYRNQIIYLPISL